MDSKRLGMQIFSAVFLVVVAIVVFYSFSHHIIAVNLCPTNTTLILLKSGPACFPQINNTVIVAGKPYSLNSSIAVSDGKLIPLSFKFIGNDPLLYIWNQNATESPGSYVFLTIPDTFKVHMQYTSSASTVFMIMTNTQYVSWVNTGRVSSGVYSYTGTSISTWFNESAGCAGYVAVIKSTTGSGFAISPNETALYAPASAPTGACA